MRPSAADPRAGQDQAFWTGCAGQFIVVSHAGRGNARHCGSRAGQGVTGSSAALEGAGAPTAWPAHQSSGSRGCRKASSISDRTRPLEAPVHQRTCEQVAARQSAASAVVAGRTFDGTGAVAWFSPSVLQKAPARFSAGGVTPWHRVAGRWCMVIFPRRLSGLGTGLRRGEFRCQLRRRRGAGSASTTSRQRQMASKIALALRIEAGNGLIRRCQCAPCRQAWLCLSRLSPFPASTQCLSPTVS